MFDANTHGGVAASRVLTQQQICIVDVKPTQLWCRSLVVKATNIFVIPVLSMKAERRQCLPHDSLTVKD